MSAVPEPHATDKAATDWVVIGGRAPGLARTMGHYLDQIATFLAPRSVDAADNALRQLATWLLANTEVRVVADISRPHVEDFKLWLAAQPGHKPGSRLSANTQR